MRIAYLCMDPKVSLFTPHRAPTIHIECTIDSLERLGHEVVPFLYGDQLGSSEAALRSRVDRHRIPGRFARRLASDLLLAFQDVARDRRVVGPFLADGGFDGIYERLYHPKGVVTREAGRGDVPVVVEVNAPAEERRQYWGSPLHGWIRRQELASLTRANAVIVMSTPLRNHYVRLGVAEHKIHVLPNGFDERRFVPDLITRDIRSELSLGDAIVVGFVGNIHPYHGPEFFLPLARRLKASRPEVRFLLVGAGPHLSGLADAFDSEGISDQFLLAGSVPHSDVPNYLAAMDMCVLPDFSWYGSAMKLLEYAAMGKTILAPDLANVRDVFTHGVNAHLFAPGEVDDLAGAVEELASDAPLRAKLGRAARERVLAHHTWMHNAKKIQEIFESLPG